MASLLREAIFGVPGESISPQNLLYIYCEIRWRGCCLLPHPACQPRHSLCDKLLAFHCEHKTDIQRALEDIDRLSGQLSRRARQEETQMLKSQLDDPRCRRRRGPQALAKIIPLVLARLGIRNGLIQGPLFACRVSGL